MRVRLSRDARQFLLEEARYLRERSPAAAARLLERMGRAQRHLAQFPTLGQLDEDGPVPGTRRLVAGDYILTYVLSADAVEVVSIRHGQMQAPPIEPGFEDETGSPDADRSGGGA